MSQPANPIDTAVPEIYEELRRIASSLFRAEPSRHTLQPTEVVNEVYLKLIEQTRSQWCNRGEILSVAAMMMRRLLVDHARGRSALKRGGESQRLDHDAIHMIPCLGKSEELLEINELLIELSRLNKRHAQVVELRFFAGMTISQTAEAMGISDFTVKSDWRIARAWLLSKLANDDSDGPREGN